MCVAPWGEKFERRLDPRGRPYYWATGRPPVPPTRRADRLVGTSRRAHHAHAARFRHDPPRQAGRHATLAARRRKRNRSLARPYGDQHDETTYALALVLLVAARLAAIGCECAGVAAPRPRRQPPAAEPAPNRSRRSIMVAGGAGRPCRRTRTRSPTSRGSSTRTIRSKVVARARAGGLLGIAGAAPSSTPKYQMMIINIDHANPTLLGAARRFDYPKSQEEFMKSVIEFNQRVKLPEIARGRGIHATCPRKARWACRFA